MAAKIRWGILATGWIADLFTKDLILTGHAVTAVGSSEAESAAVRTEALMEHYKDLKLQQGATANAGNPATARRYLRVDKATIMEAAGL